MADATTRETFQIDTDAQLGALNEVLDALREHAAALREIDDSADEASESGGRLSGVMSKVQGVAGAVGPALAGVAAVGIGGIVAGVRVGVKAFSDLNDAMADIEAQTGATGGELEGFRDVVKAVYQEGLVESVGEAAAAMTDVQRQLDLTGDALTDATNKAVVLSEVFDADIGESTRAVKQMGIAFDELGDAGQAFDLITHAMQQTGDPANDLLDTFWEYSPVMAQAGYSAAQFTSLLQSGLQAGAFNADKVADAVKEFNVRLLDGSKTTSEALGLLVDDTDAFLGALSDGSMSGADALAIVTRRLSEVDDPMKRAQIGVALFGSMYEDLGEQVILGLDPAVTTLDDVAGATDRAGKALESKLSTKWTKFTRTVTMSLGSAVEPFAGALLDNLTPALETAGEWIGENLPEAMEWLTDQIAPLQDAIIALFGGDTATIMEQFHAILANIFGEETAGQIMAFAEGAATAIAEAFGATVAWIQENWPQIQATINGALQAVRDFAGPILEEIGAFVTETLGMVVTWVVVNWPLIQSTIQRVLTFIRNVIQATLGAIQSFWQAHGEQIMALVRATWETIQTVIQSLLGAIAAIIQAIMLAIHGDWGAAWEAIKTAAQLVWDALVAIVNTALRTLRTIIDWALGQIQAGAAAAWEAIKAAAQLAWDGLVALINAALRTLRSIVEWAWDQIKTGAATAWEKIKTAATDAWEGIKTAFRGGIDAIIGFLNGAVGRMKAAGEAIVNAVKQGISDAWNDLVNWFNDKLSDLADKLPFSEPRDPRSKLRNLPGRGRAIITMLLRGIDEAMPELQARLASLTVPAPTPAGMGGAAGLRMAAPIVAPVEAPGPRVSGGLTVYGDLYIYTQATDGQSLLRELEEYAR